MRSGFQDGLRQSGHVKLHNTVYGLDPPLPLALRAGRLDSIFAAWRPLPAFD